MKALSALGEGPSHRGKGGERVRSSDGALGLVYAGNNVLHLIGSCNGVAPSFDDLPARNVGEKSGDNDTLYGVPRLLYCTSLSQHVPTTSDNSTAHPLLRDDDLLARQAQRHGPKPPQPQPVLTATNRKPAPNRRLKYLQPHQAGR